MADNSYTGQSAAGILAKNRRLDQASIFDASTQHPFGIQVVTLALDSAVAIGNPYKVGFAFKSFFVQSASDASTSVNFQAITQDSYQGSFALHLNDAMELGNAINGAFLTWAAQPGKSITIVFFVNASFRSGSQITTFQGGVSLSEGTSAANSRVVLTAATAAPVLAANATRKVAIVQNKSGDSIWIGGSSSVVNTGANMGIEVLDGSSVIWKNQGPLYAYSVLGGNIAVMEES